MFGRKAFAGWCLVVLLTAYVQSSGMQTARASAEFDHEAEFRAYEKRKLETRVSARLFPTVVEVRLFAWQFDGANGEAKQLVPKGMRLRPTEIATLRKSVWFAEEPPAIAACCIPRHAFKFYDRSRKEIGELRVCFECTCANIDGEAPPKEALSWVDWDVAAIGTIVRAHGLATDLR
jgi:hypothetical protein